MKWEKKWGLYPALSQSLDVCALWESEFPIYFFPQSRDPSLKLGFSTRMSSCFRTRCYSPSVCMAVFKPGDTRVYAAFSCTRLGWHRRTWWLWQWHGAMLVGPAIRDKGQGPSEGGTVATAPRTWWLLPGEDTRLLNSLYVPGIKHSQKWLKCWIIFCMVELIKSWVESWPNYEICELSSNRKPLLCSHSSTSRWFLLEHRLL